MGGASPREQWVGARYCRDWGYWQDQPNPSGPRRDHPLARRAMTAADRDSMPGVARVVGEGSGAGPSSIAQGAALCDRTTRRTGRSPTARCEWSGWPSVRPIEGEHAQGGGHRQGHCNDSEKACSCDGWLSAGRPGRSQPEKPGKRAGDEQVRAMSKPTSRAKGRGVPVLPTARQRGGCSPPRWRRPILGCGRPGMSRTEYGRSERRRASDGRQRPPQPTGGIGRRN